MVINHNRNYEGVTMSETDTPNPLTPHPALRKLDRFIGDWVLEGNLIGSDDTSIKGKATYEWLPGGFFLKQHVELDFAGFAQIDSFELVSYDPETDTYPSLVYSNMSPQPLPYRWKITGDEMIITVNHGPLDATFTSTFDPDGNSMRGGWRPNPGADETMNVAYDIGGNRA
jgi:hypothetical protein